MPWDPQRAPANYDLYDQRTGESLQHMPTQTTACLGCLHRRDSSDMQWPTGTAPAIPGDFCMFLHLEARAAYNTKCRGHLKKPATMPTAIGEPTK